MDRLSWIKTQGDNSEPLRGFRRSLSRTWTATKKLIRRSTRLKGLVLPTKNRNQHPRGSLVARLPPELIDHIIDYFHDDKDTLRKLSLVCHALVPSARFHLFDNLKITGANVRKIASLFANVSPDLALYVRELTLEAGDGRSSDKVFRDLRGILDGKDLRTLLQIFLLIIAPRTKNVERLVLQAVPLEQTIVGALAPCFPKLNMLSLFDCSFRCNADLDKLVRDHPGIHTLRAGRVCSMYGLTSSDPNDSIGPRLTLRQLKVTEAYSPSPLTVMPWLVSHCSAQHFVYTIYRLGQFSKINAGIIEMESLTHLHLIMYRWRRDDMEELEAEPSLVSLMPRYPPMITTMTLDAKMYMLNVVVTILAQLDPHSFVHLRTLNLWVHLEVTDVSKVDAVTWAGMDQTLSVLLSLGVVNFYNSCQDTAHIHSGSEAIEARLPILKVRKMLRFQDLEAPF